MSIFGATDFIDALLSREQWQIGAPCASVGGDMWFPEKGGSLLAAKSICGGCDVRQQCLEYALENDIRHGCWGGVSERERRRMHIDRSGRSA